MNDDDIIRYSRHILLPEIGGLGQEKIGAARVLVVGAGGLGAPVLLYLAAAGVGTLGIIDDDRVDLSNLQRQVIHDTTTIGLNKVDSAAQRLQALNAGVTVDRHVERLTPENAAALIEGYDIIVDGTDSFDARYLLNDTCHRVGRPWISAALLRFEGQISTFKSHLGPPHPCYRCLFPAPPPPGTVPSCSEAGVLGASAGMIGCLQATETVKELLGIGEGLSGRLIIIDALAARFTTVGLDRVAGCATCGGPD
ncbi:HesA/MoeB/ThiF family protein [Fodinicurvata sp. EGI_FJ10296]|uniref:HesA/MoeB/ThiF family protein n=1 Tax=Fodinicurvata sp. EGI_FJ10296 TaxID=3231908 RepID=UPI00345246AA